MYTDEREFIGDAFKLGESTVAEMRGWVWEAAGAVWRRYRWSGCSDAYSARLGHLAAIADVLSPETDSLRIVNHLAVLLAAESISNQRYLEQYPPLPSLEGKQLAYYEVAQEIKKATGDLGMQWRYGPRLLPAVQEELSDA